ncbi:MAG: hypothetical protein GYB68_00210, partial [Chloroflexi bacterium]|nr:hypothetical protein [Chloroflexota bacterium]
SLGRLGHHHGLQQIRDGRRERREAWRAEMMRRRFGHDGPPVDQNGEPAV